MTEIKKLQVFLCHASVDKPKVRDLYKYLRRRGIAPWLDAEDLLPGQDWQIEIPKALLASDVIIVCLTKNSITREGYVQKEIGFALDKAQEKPGAIFIIPAKLEECEVPERLGRFHWVDLHEEGGYPRLIRSLKARAEQLARASVEVSKVDETGPNPTAQEQAGEAARQKAESENSAREKAEAQRIAQEQIEQERIATEEAEKERLAKLKAENERIAREKSEKERLAREYEQAKRNAAQKAEEASKAREKHERAQRARAQTWARLKTPALLVGGLLLLGLGCLATWLLIQAFPVRPAPTATLQASATATPLPATLTPAPPTGVPTLAPWLTPTLAAGDVMTSPKDGMKLHYVPAGPFTMGNDNGEADEKPAHIVALNAFWIDESEVANQMYARCVKDTRCQPPSNKSSSRRKNYYDDAQYADYPVMFVSWNDASAYCSWAGRKLPSEAQWEKAARGSNANTYPWGNGLPGKDLLNYNSSVGDTTKVDSYPSGASPYGAQDMAGNVWEWVNDWYDPTYYVGAPSFTFNPSGPVSGQTRVLRGGSWYSLVNYVRSAVRYSNTSDDRGYYIGFRCALTP